MVYEITSHGVKKFNIAWELLYGLAWMIWTVDNCVPTHSENVIQVSLSRWVSPSADRLDEESTSPPQVLLRWVFPLSRSLTYCSSSSRSTRTRTKYVQTPDVAYFIHWCLKPQHRDLFFATTVKIHYVLRMANRSVCPSDVIAIVSHDKKANVGTFHHFTFYLPRISF